MNVKTIPRAMPLLLLMVLFGLLVFSVAAKSPTLDEQNHVARGLAYLKTGDLRLSQEHPPGMNVWAAWPLLLDPEIELPLDSASWANGEWYGFADKLLWQVNDRPQQMIFATRVPVMWLTLLLAALVYRWAYALGGLAAGLVAMVLLVFDPNILAHGRLTTTDLGVTAASLALMFALWSALRRDSFGSWLVAGATLGAAQLCKFSALLLVPVTLLIVLLVWVGFPAKAFTPGRWAWLGVRLLALLGVGSAVIWAGYAFTWGPILALDGISGPAPAYWSGIQAILRRTGAGNPAFLMGQYSREGWWSYFPVAFAIKTPLPTLILLLFGLGMWARSMVRKGSWSEGLRVRMRARPAIDVAGALAIGSPCLILPVLSFWGVAMAGSFNVGYRHILPSLPFLYVFVGWRIGWLLGGRFPAQVFTPERLDRPLRLVIPSALLLWLIGSTVAIAPHYLAFFNRLAEGPDGGYRFLVDSNLDWGQDLPGLARYVNQHGIDHVFLSWFGAAHPEAYDLPFHPLPGFWRFRDEPAAYGFNPYAPAAGTYAISASNLQGVALADHDLYAWFRERAPVARIGHSILIYDVSPAHASTPQGTVVLGVPMAQLADEERTMLRKGAAVRQYDPETGLIVPLTAEEVWYIAPEPPGWARPTREGPGYRVVHSPLGRHSDGELHWREMGPRFGEFVLLLSHRVDKVSPIQDRMLRVIVQWGVEGSPHREAVSFAHLLDREGQYVAGWDGLAAPATCWQQGDLVQQEYKIPLPTALRPGVYQLEVGWYDAETGLRWQASAGGSPVGDRWLLPDVEVPG